MKIRRVGAELFFADRTDGHDKANRRFSQFSEKRLKMRVTGSSGIIRVLTGYNTLRLVTVKIHCNRKARQHRHVSRCTYSSDSLREKKQTTLLALRYLRMINAVVIPDEYDTLITQSQ